MLLTLKVLDVNNQILFERSGEDFVDLVVNREYQEGDKIALSASEKRVYINWQVDDALGRAFVYLLDDEEYLIPFGEKRICYSPKVFSGKTHYIFAEAASNDEIAMYRNLALNPADQHRDVNCYPHATANVETRGESVFAAKNAIDGVRANRSHGNWPYGSWGINRQDDAMLKVEFGRTIIADKVVLYTRSDFPHDNWWIQVTLRFSDGSCADFHMEKSEHAHVFTFPQKEITWIELCNLIKADDPSPFPALTQIEVFGKNKQQ